MASGPPRIAILLPPSEGKALGGRGRPWAPGRAALPSLDATRAALVAELGPGIATAPTMPAIQRYTGVLYRELDWSSLPPDAQRLGRRVVLTFSGLWGAVAPADPIPYYKLKMTGRAAAWRPALTEALADRLKGRTVWDLLPIEHSAGWTPALVPYRRRLTVRFVDARGATVNHWNKLLKGALVRRLLTEPTADPLDLAGWDHPLGYRLDLDASTLDRGTDPAVLVFVERR